MSCSSERQRKVRELIPLGTSQAQAIFRVATALAYADGLPISEAIEFGIEQAREDASDFQPVYDVALLVLD
jgi:hypothetical protein